eukprot:Pgem_evm1s19049
MRTPLHQIQLINTLLTMHCKKALTHTSYKSDEIKLELQGIADLIEQSKVSSTLLLNLISDILDISKIEAGELTICTEDMELTDCIEHVCSMFNKLAKEKEITFKIVFLSVELLSVSSATGLEPNKYITVKVKDTGIGMSKESMGKLFTPFYQADESVATRKYGGTGLGLSICKHFAEKMGLQIDVSSVKNVGSTFTITFLTTKHRMLLKSCEVGNTYINGKLVKKLQLPTLESKKSSGLPTCSPLTSTSAMLPPQSSICKSIDPDKTGHTKEKAKKKKQKSMLREMKILVCDDNLVSCKLLVGLIKKLGYASKYVTSGMEALKEIEKNKYNVLLLDLYMPEMDGFEVGRIIKKMDIRELHIIAASASVCSEDRILALEIGMDGFIPKPFALDHLRSTLTDIANSHNNKKINTENDIVKGEILFTETSNGINNEMYSLFGVLPLTFVGSVFGRNISSSQRYPCRVNPVPRRIPPKKWFMSPFAMAVIGGILPFLSILME